MFQNRRDISESSNFKILLLLNNTFMHENSKTENIFPFNHKQLYDGHIFQFSFRTDALLR